MTWQITYDSLNIELGMNDLLQSKIPLAQQEKYKNHYNTGSPKIGVIHQDFLSDGKNLGFLIILRK